MTGNSPLSVEAHSQLLQRLAEKFYKTSGSLTAALRTVVDALNLFLLDRNLRSTSVGRQGVGQLILVALRADTAYLTQCGGVHTFVVTPQETRDLYEPQSAGRGLGLSRTTPMRFLQVKLNPDDFLVLTTQASASWTNTLLAHPGQLGLESLRRRMLELGGPEFNAVVVQVLAGTGKLRILKPKAEGASPSRPLTPVATMNPDSTARPTPVEDKRPGLPSLPVDSQAEIAQYVEAKRTELPSAPAETPADTPVVNEDRRPGLPPIPVAPQAAHPEESYAPARVLPEADFSLPPAPHDDLPLSKPQKIPHVPRPRAESKLLADSRHKLGMVGSAILRALRSSLATLASALLRLLKSLLPDADVLRIPPSMMVFIALAIPLILATVGGVVYLQRGRSQQHEVYFQQAVEDAAYATTLTNPLEQRMAWLTVIGELDKAENYTVSSQSQELRNTAYENLDTLDAIKRVGYQPAIVGGLDSNVRVTRIVATATDLYLLNAEQGNVLRAIMTGRGYEIDPNFQCGPTFGPIDVGPLIDIAELPPGSFENASLLGLDASGNLLYCVIGGQPYSASMAPPNTGFGEPIAITLDRSDLYVLDPKVNAVWMYRNLEVSQQPRLFFGDEIPPMEDVIDLTAYNEDLYLLHADGHITKCIYSGMAESPTRCDDPYPYSDNRPGRVHGPVIEDTVFNQMYFLSFPERSIYFLDPANRSVYYFSVLLNLQCQYQQKAPIATGKATAFAVSPNRTLFLAVGNNIYYAGMP
jgi:hypothetical protein